MRNYVFQKRIVGFVNFVRNEEMTTVIGQVKTATYIHDDLRTCFAI